MRLQKLGLIILMGLLLTACVTTHPVPPTGAGKTETDTDRGVRYLLGRGVEQSNEQAFYYFSQAADDDNPVAQNEIAYLYATGKGTAQNNAKALKYYLKAANHGLSSAQYNVGLFYLHGIGVTPDASIAKSWFEKAAAHHFEPAQVILENLPAEAPQ